MQLSLTKYLRDSSLFEVRSKSIDSTTWRSIFKAVNELREDFKCHVGCGNGSLYYSNWLDVGPLCDMIPFVHIGDTDLSIRIFIWSQGSILKGWLLFF